MDSKKKNTKKIPYQERLRGYEADKQLLLSKPHISAQDYSNKMQSLRDKWRI